MTSLLTRFDLEVGVRFKINCAGERICSKVRRRNGKVGFLKKVKNKLCYKVEYNCLKSKIFRI